VVTSQVEQAAGGVPPASEPGPPGRPPRWPAWFGPAAFLAGLVCTLIAFAIAGVVVAATGHKLPSSGPGIEIGGTLVQDGFFVAAAVAFAASVAPPRPWQFGLGGAPIGPTLKRSAAALGAFYVFVALYTGLLHPHGHQSVAKDLGATNGGLDMVLGGILVVAIAPAAEEFFFRGFFYRALRSRFSMLAAALIDAVVFGAIHYTDPKTLSLLPILAVLGFLFCLLYERTGTLFATIALHAINNGIAYGGTVHGSGGLSAGLVAAVLVACGLALRLVPGRVPLLR
jgi:uncharacterized protein